MEGTIPKVHSTVLYHDYRHRRHVHNGHNRCFPSIDVSLATTPPHPIGRLDKHYLRAPLANNVALYARESLTCLPHYVTAGKKKKQSKKFIIVSLLAFLPKSYLAVFVKQEKEISPHAKSPVGSIETVLARWKGLRCLRLFGQPNGHLIYLRRWSRMSRLLFTNGSSARQAARLPDCLTSVCAHTRTCPVEHFGVIWWQHWARSQHVFIDWFLLPLWWCAILLQCPNRTLLHFGWPSCLGTCWGHQLLSWWLLAKK